MKLSEVGRCTLTVGSTVPTGWGRGLYENKRAGWHPCLSLSAPHLWTECDQLPYTPVTMPSQVCGLKLVTVR